MLEKVYGAIILLMIASAISFSMKSQAVPADPTPHALVQPDGTTVVARQWGDEMSHGWETGEGYTILYDERGKAWVYAELGADGELISTHRIAGIDNPPPATAKNLRPTSAARMKIRPKGTTQELALRNMWQQGKTTPGDFVAATGTRYVPVLLINFSDTTTTYSKSDFTSLVFGPGLKSMKAHYEEMSYDLFTIAGEVSGWYTASKGHDYYGQSDDSFHDMYAATLVIEAVKAADNGGFNFAAYDNNGDCYVDAVLVVHQGTGEEAGGGTSSIWSHRWSLNSAQYFGDGTGEYTTKTTCTADPSQKIKVNDYTIQPEKLWHGLTTVGVFSHEYGHVLGLPDLYDTDGSSEGIGEWSLMASGGWCYVSTAGDTPSHLDAWSKYVLGWVSPTKVAGTVTGRPVENADTYASVYQLLNGSPSGGGEYFLVENRQKTPGSFDEGLPGAGLLIWHIDESVSNNKNECYPGGHSCSSQHYHVALVQADNGWDLEQGTNRGDSEDPFSSSTNATFNDTSSPSSNRYDGSASDASVTAIGASGPTMMATFSAPLVPAQYTLTVSKSGSGTVTSVPAGITCGADCTETYNYGTNVTLSATPDASSTFTGWGEAGCPGTDTCAVTMDQARTVTATFTKKTYTLTITLAGTGSGTVACNGAVCSPNYNHGTSVVIAATPYSGSRFDGFAGCDSVSGTSCTVSMISAKTVSAIFTAVSILTVTKPGTGSGTVTSTPGGINCGVDCTEAFLKNISVTLTATPSSGSDFAYYAGGCANASPICSLTLATDTSITATFVSEKTKKVNLTVSKTKTNKGDGTVTSTDGRINCGSDCKDSYYPGSPVILKAVPLEGSVFSAWSKECPFPDGDTCTLTLDKALTVKAIFVGPYTVKVQKTAKNKGTGTVTSTDGKINCGTDCQEAYLYNTPVTLNAAPDPLSVFSSWSGTGVTCLGTGTCTVTMDKAKTVKATFTGPSLLKVTITSKNKGSGTVTSNPPGITCTIGSTTCSQAYLYNSTVTLTADPDDGSTFISFSGCTATSGPTCTVTMDKAKTVKATFDKPKTTGGADVIEVWGETGGDVSEEPAGAGQVRSTGGTKEEED